MPVLQLKHESGHEASIAFRRRRPRNALAVHVSGQMADPVQLNGDTTQVNTRALLLILENIKNNAELETKLPSAIKPIGAEGEHKMESINSRIHKKSKQVGVSDKQCALCKKYGRQYKSHITHDFRKFNPNGTLIKRNGGAGSAQRNGHADKNHSNQREC
jgi:hypothetical protein